MEAPKESGMHWKCQESSECWSCRWLLLYSAVLHSWGDSLRSQAGHSTEEEEIDDTVQKKKGNRVALIGEAWVEGGGVVVKWLDDIGGY